MLSSIQILAILAACANAHIVITTPQPFEGSINSPIGADVAFPCQGKTSGPSNTLELGSTQDLAFMGSTVHAGGSCQISLTYDSPPTASSSWKVITSFEGGCPARGQTGNLTPESATLPVPDKYNYTVPADIPSGKATLAWTWMNKSGGVREFYMNCAAVELTGAGGDASAFETLPDMAVANVPEVNSCASVENKDISYENPGATVFREAAGDFSPLSGSNCVAGGAAAARAVRRGSNGKVARAF